MFANFAVALAYEDLLPFGLIFLDSFFLFRVDLELLVLSGQTPLLSIYKRRK